MIARTVVIIFTLILIFLSSSLDIFFSKEELEKMGVHSGELELVSKGE